jgi:hypothetical protein
LGEGYAVVCPKNARQETLAVRLREHFTFSPSRNQNDECHRVAQRLNARDVHNADAVVAALEDLSEVFNHVWVDCAWGPALGFFLELGPRSTFQNLVFDNKFLTIFGMRSIHIWSSSP